MAKFNIAMVSDFFYPNKGGIETHIIELSLRLIKNGHKVIGITHRYDNCYPIEYYGALKIYYLNTPVFFKNTTFPAIFSNFFTVVDVLKEEGINIVHGHQSMSSLAAETILHAQVIGLHTVFTDHSLFETGALENIVVNKLNTLILGNINKAICASYTLKGNLMRRIGINSENVHVIPNAVAKVFKPGKIDRRNKIRIISFSRFVYRKGIDLLIQAVPKICALDERIEFVIVGGGPKRYELEQMIDEENLHDKVKLLGELEHSLMPKIISGCDIFINTSLTESFCIAIIEAAACGLQVISTHVGAVEEVLPSSMITLVELNSESIVKGVLKAIKKRCKFSKDEISRKVKRNYSWKRITKETEKIYESISNTRMFIKDMGVLFRIIIMLELFLLFVYEKFVKTKRDRFVYKN